MLKDHPVAELFPLMTEDQIKELAENIKSNGLKNSIVLLDNKILDGRNRYRACQLVDVDPKTTEYKGKDPLSDVISWNLHRRHLNESQRAVVAAKLANMKEGAPIKNTAQICAVISQPGAAHKLNVSRRIVQDAKAIMRDDPERIKDIESGKKTVNETKREISREKVKANLNDIKVKKAKELEGVFDVIVIDPPWPMEKIERDVAPNQVKELDYPTMSIEEIKAFKVPAAKDCHVWLWTTHKFLPAAFKILDAWGAKYVCTFVWHKPGGFQPFGLPQYNCEFALYARIGVPQFTETKAFPVCFESKRGRHSEKPQDFYDMIARVTGGRRIEIFSRSKRDGFDVWGNEV